MTKFIVSLITLLYLTTAYADLPKIQYANSIHQILSYLHATDTAIMDFTQIDSEGNEAYGSLLINKPHKFRCNYYAPFPMLIIGNKNYVSIYDYDMDTTIRIKPEENIFNFLLAHDERFLDHFQLESLITDNSTIKIVLSHNKSDAYCEIVFDKNTQYIKCLKIFEGDNITTIHFYNMRQVQKFADSLFILQNPEIYGPPERLSKDTLDMKILYLNNSKSST